MTQPVQLLITSIVLLLLEGKNERTGGLEETHRLVLSGRDSPGQEVGPVRCMRWTPDGRALALAWGHVPRDSPLISPGGGLKCEDVRAPTGAGLSVWSTFGALLMCTLGWNNQTTRLNKYPDGPFTDRGCNGKKIDEYSLNIHSLYAAVVGDGQGVAVAGRTGLAHVTLPTCRWRLFGNETQERDFAVTGGLLWWKPYSQEKAAILSPNEINDNGYEFP
ncbi:hypothetical protein J437_LFUL014962 [Ladona fulva]|uniref:Uncharacterized protein n=1 Tax=Ladona fulva TaxID=123851 RepID=A0A8K0PAE2_LADFU|nr:hypothetical protein J437_LFUL014962 [Ladona fulva]